jgi:hypothetical protein
MSTRGIASMAVMAAVEAHRVPDELLAEGKGGYLVRGPVNMVKLASWDGKGMPETDWVGPFYGPIPSGAFAGVLKSQSQVRWRFWMPIPEQGHKRIDKPPSIRAGAGAKLHEKAQRSLEIKKNKHVLRLTLGPQGSFIGKMH